MPLQGRFDDTSGRPYIEGRLVIPRFNIVSLVSFLVDTGADSLLLHPADGVRMGLDYTKLNGSQSTIGIGGISSNFVEEALLGFLEPGVAIHVYRVTLAIAPIRPDAMDLPSLLGREVLDHWEMTYNARTKSLLFQVLGAHLTIPLPKRS